MRRHNTLLLGLSTLGLSASLVGCGQAGSSSGTAAGAASSAASAVGSAAGSLASGAASAASGAASGAASAASSAASAAACQKATGQELVVLKDDKQLQTVDNVIPAINAKAATPALVSALDRVADALTTEELVGLNRQVVKERKSAATVAKDFVSAKGLASGGSSGGSGAVTIGAANFAENEILANIYAEVLRGAGFDPSVKKIGNRELYEPALEKGELQVVPEYAGTLTEFLNKKDNGPRAKPLASGDLDATATALTRLGDKHGLKFGKPAQAADQNAFAVTKAFAEKNGVQSLSDLASKCGGGATLVLGGPPECPKRPFCQPGLQDTYGLAFKSFSSLDAGGPLTQTALRTGKVDVGLVFSSDGGLTG